MGWKKISEQNIFDRPFAAAEEWHMVDPSGREHRFDVGRFPNAVLVFGVTPDQQVLLLRQYIIAEESYQTSMVAGVIEGDEDPEETARRELREEAGCEAATITHLGSMNRNKWAVGTYHFMLAQGVMQTQEQQLDGAEDIAPYFVSMEQCREMLERMEIHDPPIALLAWYAFSYLDKQEL